MFRGYYDYSQAKSRRGRKKQDSNTGFNSNTFEGLEQIKDPARLYENYTEYRVHLLDDKGIKRHLTISYSNPNFPTMEDHRSPILPNMISDADLDLHDLQHIRNRETFPRYRDGPPAHYYKPPKKESPIEDLNSSVETIHFHDKVRRIDYVLAYQLDKRNPAADDKKREKRATFEKNLKKEGLQLELEDKRLSQDGETYFLKIHASWEVLTRYAELMNLKMPIKQLNEEDEDEEVKPPENLCKCQNSPFEYNKSLIPDDPQYFTCAFNRDRASQFIIKDRDNFFSTAQRSRIVWEILLHTRYDDHTPNKLGINRLLSNHTYLSAFPLHEGKYNQSFNEMQQALNTRTLLFMEWARPRCWYKKQPLHLIRKYFGDKIGIYFAWLGFYTSMLIPAAVVGLICFFYGVITLPGSLPAADICDEDGVGNITICPLCDKSCPYKKLSESCDFSKVTYLFDNPATVFFSVFMSFWATMFLELWKRYQARIVWEWDLTHLEEEEEPPRPEFQSSVRTLKVNPVTKAKEPFMPSWKRTLRVVAASSIVLFMLMVVVAAVFGVIVYRIAVQTVLFSSSDYFIRENAKITVSVTSALLNLLIILILDKVYQKIALALTNLERPRTQTEFETSFTFKMFLFQSINFYSSLIYIAFFKGSFLGHPGDHTTYITEGSRHDMCDPAGCLFELCVQLAIIMVGKQIMNNITEIMFPKIQNWWRARRSKANTKQLYTRWEKDYDLEPLDHLTLFNEYLEMVIQFGFVTIFVAAFPLAPLFALLNNIVEIRLDAYKFVTQIRRPMAARANNIGAWLQILKSVSTLAVIVNSFVIAYTSGFVPRMVYLYQYSKYGNLTGYIENTLSKFDTMDFVDGVTGPSKKLRDEFNPPYCWYRDYRNPPVDNGTSHYQRSLQYWHVFAARLAFVIVFEHLVFLTTGLLAYIIPDVPSDVKVNIRREKVLAKEALYAAELAKLNQDHANQRDNISIGAEDQEQSSTPDPLLNYSLEGGRHNNYM